MKTKMVLPFLILAAVPFIMVLGNSMLIPILPQIKHQLDLTPFQVGLIITLFSFPAGLLIPLAGALSDHIGRKTIMAPALVIYGCGGLAAGLAAVLLPHPYPWILVGRVIQGIGAGGTYQLAMALTSDVFTSAERTKVLGYLEAANGFGKVLSPVLGAALGLISWYAPFFAYGLLALPIAICVWIFVQEPKSTQTRMTPREYWRKLRDIFRAKAGSLLAAYSAGAVGLFLLFGLLSYFSDELESRFHVTGFAKGGVLAVPVGMMSLMSFFGGLYMQSHRRLLKPAIIVGLALMTIGMACLPFGRETVAVFVALTTLIAAGVGILLPPLNTFITSATGADERGLVTCLYGSVRFFGVAAGPPVFGLLSTDHLGLMTLGGAVTAALSALAVLIWLNPRMMVKTQGQA